MSNADDERNLGSYQESYHDLPFEPTQEFYRRRNLLFWLADKGDLGNVLEVGTGRSSIFNHLESFLRGTVIEPIDDFLKVAEKNLSHNDNLDFFLGTFGEFVLQPKVSRFNTVIVSSLLHELTHPNKFLHELKLVIEPCSSVFFIVSNRFSVHRILGVHIGIQKNLTEKTQTQIAMQQFSGSFSPNELTSILNENGFEVERLKSFFIKPLPHKQMQNLLDGGLITQDFLDTLDRISDHFPNLGSELIVEARLRA